MSEFLCRFGRSFDDPLYQNLEQVVRIELTQLPWQGKRLPLHHTCIKEQLKLVAVNRIERLTSPYERPVIPLHHTALLYLLYHINIHLSTKITLSCDFF